MRRTRRSVSADSWRSMQHQRSQELMETATRLEREVVTHKRAIRQHREQLKSTAAALQEVRRRCAELGIRFTEVAPQGEPH